MGRDVWGGLMEIAMALIALSFFTLVIGQAGNTSKVITSSANSLGGLLGIFTMQNGGFGGMLSGMGGYNSGLIA